MTTNVQNAKKDSLLNVSRFLSCIFYKYSQTWRTSGCIRNVHQQQGLFVLWHFWIPHPILMWLDFCTSQKIKFFFNDVCSCYVEVLHPHTRLLAVSLMEYQLKDYRKRKVAGKFQPKLLLVGDFVYWFENYVDIRLHNSVLNASLHQLHYDGIIASSEKLPM